MSTKNTTKNNATKTNKTATEILNIVELKKLFVELGVLPKFTDSVHYVGCGTRANVFSVNALKTRYNVYCNDEVFKMVSGVNGCEYTANGNATDKTRNNLIVANTTEQLKKLIEKVKSLNGVAIA